MLPCTSRYPTPSDFDLMRPAIGPSLARTVPSAVRIAAGGQSSGNDGAYSARSVASGFLRRTSALASTPTTATSSIVITAPADRAAAAPAARRCRGRYRATAQLRAQRAERPDQARRAARAPVLERQHRRQQARAGAERAQDRRLVDALELRHRHRADRISTPLAARCRRRWRSPGRRCRRPPGCGR